MKTLSKTVALLAMFGLCTLAHACPKGGSKWATDRVEARSTDVYHVVLNGDELATITVDGDGDTDLDLYVYDENGNEVASDTDSTDYCVARIVPRWTGKFTIEIRNLGRCYNEYEIEVR